MVLKMEKWKELVEKYDKMTEFEKQTEKLQLEFDEMVNQLIPEIHSQITPNQNWEPEEKFHLGCPVCQERAVKEVKKYLENLS